MPEIGSVVDWIESHTTTVDLLKWALIIVLAWVLGVFRFLRSLTRKPTARVSEVTSRCFVEEMDEFEGHTDAMRAALLIDIEVVNQSSEPIVVRTLEMCVGRKLCLRRWGPPISAVSLPDRVQHQMGSGMRLLRNWFAKFPDGNDSLTVEGKVAPKDAESGFALFVSFTYGTWNPNTSDDRVPVLVRAGLATGQQIRTKARIPVTRDAEFFEGLVPGILEQIRHPTAWNVPLRY